MRVADVEIPQFVRSGRKGTKRGQCPVDRKRCFSVVHGGYNHAWNKGLSEITTVNLLNDLICIPCFFFKARLVASTSSVRFDHTLRIR